MNNHKTNNSLPNAKIKLRLDHLPNKKEISVLDCYGGDGVIWSGVKKQTDKQIRVLSIDKQEYKSVDIVCDNLKVLAGIDLSKFDVVDLDAYGCPFAQMQTLFRRGFVGEVFVTYIQTGMGNLPTGILLQAGFSKEMLKKAQTIFTRKPMMVLDTYLSNQGITSYDEISLDRKHYLHFTVSQIDKGD